MPCPTVQADFFRWSLQDSNWGPPDSESFTLPTELVMLLISFICNTLLIVVCFIQCIKYINVQIDFTVSKQLKDYLSSNNLGNIYQSAYKAGHSTETTLLKIKSDIHLNLAQGLPTALVLLDLSAAFDTIDHLKLFDCLSSWFGFSNTILNWFKSYMVWAKSVC